VDQFSPLSEKLRAGQSLQWSPDGTRIALAVTLFGSREDLPIFRPTLLILDVATGREIFRFEGVHVVGSASWSPDGNRILVADSDDVVRILDLTTQELSPVPFLPGPRKEAWERGAQRTLGFAAADRLLVATQRGKTMTISTVATATGAACSDLAPLPTYPSYRPCRLPRRSRER
jgi:dipeptidyl aminopeptidase/acylaminoacyl peptidase